MEDKILDNLFDNDLNIGGVIIKNFTVKTEFEFQGLFRKMSKFASEDDKINSDFIFDKVPFDLAEKVANWLDLNSNINEQLTKGNVIDKCIIFISAYLDYEDFKKKLKEP